MTVRVVGYLPVQGYTGRTLSQVSSLEKYFPKRPVSSDLLCRVREGVCLDEEGSNLCERSFLLSLKKSGSKRYESTDSSEIKTLSGSLQVKNLIWLILSVKILDRI